MTASPVVLDDLRTRVRQLEGRPATQQVATHPALSGLLQLHTGGVYQAHSASVLSLLMAGPSLAGAWCGAVGMPSLGVESFAATGVRLDRLVLVPEPGDAWLEVTAALIDVLSVVAVAVPQHVNQSDANRLTARLRHRGAIMFTTGAWPRADAQIRLTDQQWVGVGRGHGYLQARRATIEVQRGSAPPRRQPIWYPDHDQQIRINTGVSTSDQEPILRRVG